MSDIYMLSYVSWSLYYSQISMATKTTQVHTVFSRQSYIDVETGCVEPLIMNVVHVQLWLMCSWGSVFSLALSLLGMS